MATAFETFVRKVDALTREASSAAARIAGVATAQRCTERYMQHVLHGAPDSSYSIVSPVGTQGQSTSIHDRAGWGVVGVDAGLERETRYRLEGVYGGDQLPIVAGALAR